MKKFNAEGPGYGLFDLTTSSRDVEMAFLKSGHSPVQITSKAWDSALAPAKRSQPRQRVVYRRFVKRVLDIVFILAALPFALPIIMICAIALWFEGGSPFYSQDRIGRNGSRFSILKLRTMVRNADQVLEEYLAADPNMRREWDTLQKIKNDPRVTRVGQFLRATSLDELPQLLNVLKGDMSLVGPRPMLPEQEEMYGEMTAYVAVRPGITGLWQVSARNGNTFRYRNEVDGAYERSLTFGTDLAILIKTVGVVLRRTGY